MIAEFKTNRWSALPLIAAIVALNSVVLAEQLKLKEILDKPGVAEQMQASYSGKSTYDGHQDTPLVVQARKFALRINPPPPPQPVQPMPTENRPVRPKAEVSASFKLLGTSYHFGDAAQSWALIDEIGKGLHWVKQGSKVGHLNIEKVGDGSVLINDNGRRYELKAERKSMPDLVKSYSGQLEKTETIRLLDNIEQPPAEPIPAAAESNVSVSGAAASETAVVEQVPSEPVLTPEEQLKKTQENIEWLKQMQNDPNFKAVSDSESNDLNGLGQMLKMLEEEAKNLQQQASAQDTNTQKPEVKEEKRPESASPAKKEPNAPVESTRTRRIRTVK